MLYTLGQASKAVGKAKGTIKNAIDKGRLSASKDDKGQYKIDAAELHRVYPLHTEQVNLNAVEPPVEQSFTQAERAELEARIALLEETIERERQNTDEWRKQAQTLALAAPASNRGSLWQRLFSR